MYTPLQKEKKIMSFKPIAWIQNYHGANTKQKKLKNKEYIHFSDWYSYENWKNIQSLKVSIV